MLCFFFFFIELCFIYHVKYNILVCQASYKYPYDTTSGLKRAYKYSVFVVWMWIMQNAKDPCAAGFTAFLFFWSFKCIDMHCCAVGTVRWFVHIVSQQCMCTNKRKYCLLVAVNLHMDKKVHYTHCNSFKSMFYGKSFHYLHFYAFLDTENFQVFQLSVDIL